MFVAMKSTGGGVACGLQAALMQSNRIPIPANRENRIIKSSFLKRWDEYTRHGQKLHLFTLREVRQCCCMGALARIALKSICQLKLF
jgi:hypothetical protein